MVNSVSFSNDVGYVKSDIIIENEKENYGD